MQDQESRLKAPQTKDPSTGRASTLPVEKVIPEVKATLDRKRAAVLQAEPGAGKTTRVPLALLNEPWLGGQKILMLEPRRLAARTCAGYMAGILGEPLGKTVGFQIRMEQKTGPDTRILIITEGILTRMIQSDPSLEGVGLVIFDEFHERHIHSDLGLALCLEIASVFRPDLRLLVMSATMDTRALSRLMDNAPVIQSQGKVFPVDTVYLPPPEPVPVRRGGRFSPVLRTCALAVEKALAEDSGDLLVFLPGVGEIRKMETLLAGRLDDHTCLIPLFGNLDLKRQSRAIEPSGPGKRKIVLATAIAETSLTIEGIRVVVDSGLMRLPRFNPGSGMTRLDTLPVSKASADQRRGRAGRTAPGRCYRIWSSHVHQGLVPFHRPEILSTDLAGLVLELALWGVRDPGELKWLDVPETQRVEQARQLLESLGALDGSGRVTDQGKQIARAGLHPRLAHMVMVGRGRNLGYLACVLAALLEERDILSRDRACDPSVWLRLEILEKLDQNRPIGREDGVNMGRARSVLSAAAHLRRKMKIPRGKLDAREAGSLLAAAFPDRVAKRRRGLSYVMASGSGACFRNQNLLSSQEFIVAAQVDGNPKNARVFLGAGYSKQDLERDFPQRLDRKETMEWDPEGLCVRATLRNRYGHLVLEERPVSRPDPARVRKIMIQAVQDMGLACLPWTRKSDSLRHRCVFLRIRAGLDHLPDLSDAALENCLEHWLGPFLDGVRSARGLNRVDIYGALTGMMAWKDLQEIQSHAPTHLTVPSGSRVPLAYADQGKILESPVLAVRLQEMFGLTRTPAVCKIPVTLHLLSPAGRPVQITRDLENFWANTYPDVKKDLKGRYPKHFWPDNPLEAAPTRRAKPRKK